MTTQGEQRCTYHAKLFLICEQAPWSFDEFGARFAAARVVRGLQTDARTFVLRAQQLLRKTIRAIESLLLIVPMNRTLISVCCLGKL